jgi:hypothetical protein
MRICLILSPNATLVEDHLAGRVEFHETSPRLVTRGIRSRRDLSHIDVTTKVLVERFALSREWAIKVKLTLSRSIV